MMFPDMSEVKLCGPVSGQGSDCTDEMTPLGHGIHYDHDGVFSVRFWELRYEVYTDGVPGRIWDRKWMQFPSRRFANKLCAVMRSTKPIDCEMKIKESSNRTRLIK